MSKPLSSTINALIADHQVLYHKVRGYHWNVTGHEFFELHEKFEELYTSLAARVDALAERLKARGEAPVVALKDVLAQARLKEDAGTPAATDMVRNLIGDIEALNGHCESAHSAAGDAGDGTTQRLLEDFIDDHQKTLWMYRAFLG